MRKEDMAAYLDYVSRHHSPIHPGTAHTAGALDAFRNYRRRMKPRTARPSDAAEPYSGTPYVMTAHGPSLATTTGRGP
jgi:hypothetical protein